VDLVRLLPPPQLDEVFIPPPQAKPLVIGPPPFSSFFSSCTLIGVDLPREHRDRPPQMYLPSLPPPHRAIKFDAWSTLPLNLPFFLSDMVNPSVGHSDKILLFSWPQPVKVLLFFFIPVCHDFRCFPCSRRPPFSEKILPALRCSGSFLLASSGNLSFALGLPLPLPE